MRVFVRSSLVLVLLLAGGCRKLMPEAPADDRLLDGPVAGLSAAEHTRFLVGDVAFNEEVFTSATGLGPLFVSTSCGSCHAGDGRGHPFTSLTRFGQVDATGNQYLDQGGPQLQHRAIPGFSPESVPAGATSTRLLPPPNTGLGFLDAVPDADLLQLADPDDADGDGISGVPNWVVTPAYVTHRPGSMELEGRHIGRFGRKGGAYDLLVQTANAYNQDIGITSSYAPYDTYTGSAIDPEIATGTVDDVVFYLRTLKAPIQRDRGDAQVMAGEQVFIAVGCAKCHTPELRTGPSSIAALANTTIRPFSDLLLHDMGPGLDDGYTEGSALTSEWRTPPLWGLGLSPDSQGGTYFLMHDGRATSIQQAIDAHGGEGQASRDAARQLSNTDRDALLRFLESL
ncbi:MAG TPA: di-heme oxidoredictase family protein [Flavobacteriales bacterium]|nr:di-heme oxidoredictase family protein [Flavobacteriales bacterium]